MWVNQYRNLFYKEIAKPFLDELKEDISFTWFDIRDYEKPLFTPAQPDPLYRSS